MAKAKLLLEWRRYRGKKVPTSYKQGTDRCYKEWRTTCGRYRIVWRSEYDGIPMDPGYYPTTLGDPEFGILWDKLAQRQYKLNRTMLAAQKLCEVHFREHFPLAAAELLGRCSKPKCRKNAVAGTDHCLDHTLKSKKPKPKPKAKKPKAKTVAPPMQVVSGTVLEQPVKPKRKAPKKECPGCKTKVGPRTLKCPECGHVFKKKAKK